MKRDGSDPNSDPLLPPPPSRAGGLRRSAEPARTPPANGAGVGRTGGAVLMLAGAALTVVALFLPRFHVSGGGSDTTVTGISGVGVGLLLLSGFAAVRAVAAIRPDLVPMPFAFPLLTGALMALLVYRRWIDLSHALDNARTLPGIDASIGVGFWLTVVGAALVLTGGALMQFGSRRA